MAQLILASQSPRRQELLRRIGVDDFTVLATDSDESYDPRWSPEELVSRLSARKAAAAAAQAGPDALVIAADTMVFLDGARLGKPRDEADAFPCSPPSPAGSTACAPASPCAGGIPSAPRRRPRRSPSAP